MATSQELLAQAQTLQAQMDALRQQAESQAAAEAANAAPLTPVNPRTAFESLLSFLEQVEHNSQQAADLNIFRAFVRTVAEDIVDSSLSAESAGPQSGLVQAPPADPTVAPVAS